MESNLTRNQKITKTKEFLDQHDGKCRIEVNIRFDDECGNGHNTFVVTANVNAIRGKEISGGCQHELIVKHFPELKKYIKWHLCSTDEPMHYVANTIYHATAYKEGVLSPKKANREYARSTAIWPDGYLYQLRSEDLLRERLPKLLKEFKADIEEIGFTW